MKIRAVVFDLDGTLAEFNLDYGVVRAEVLQFLVDRGLPLSIFSSEKSIFGILNKAEVYMRNNGKREQFSDVRKAVFSIAGKHELAAAHETSILPGVFELLKNLRRMNLKLAIFTINGEKSTEYILSKLQLKHFFDVIVTREAVSRVKPDGAHLAAVLDALDVEADEVIVVGDSVSDVLSAKTLNVASVGLVTERTSEKRLSSAGALHIIKSIVELPLVISKVSQSNV